jgi:hypothetical protein
MAEKVVSNQAEIDAAKAKADAAATAKKAAETAATAALAAQKKLVQAVTGKVNAKTGVTKVKPISNKELTAIMNANKTARNQLNAASTAYATAQANVVAIPETEYREILGTTGREILKNKMIELGIPSTIIDSSVTFIDTLVTDGMSIDAATEAYYNNKDFTTKAGTKVTSPFYTEFTYLRESAPKDANLPTPLELMKFKLGVKNLVTTYGRSALFSSDDALKNYISNGVRLTDLDVRFADAGVASTAANPDTVKTLKKLGYITDTQDVADFLLDSKIGQQQFEINRNTAAFAQQALKRAGSGISFDAARMKQLAATAGVTQGTAAEAEKAGAVGYETIGLQLNPLTKIESIYGKPTDATGKNLTDVQVRSQLQTELEAEQFQGTASERRKRRIEEEQLAYQRKSGTVTGGSGASISLGRGGITGAL